MYPKTSTLCGITTEKDTIIREMKTYQVQDPYREEHQTEKQECLGGIPTCTHSQFL